MCSFDELLYALVTAEPGERVKVKEGQLSKTSAIDGGVRVPNYHAGQWVAVNGVLPPTPMRVLANA